jgi:hypothetical protein
MPLAKGKQIATLLQKPVGSMQYGLEYSHFVTKQQHSINSLYTPAPVIIRYLKGEI